MEEKLNLKLGVIEVEVLIKMLENPEKKWSFKELINAVRISEVHLRKVLTKFQFHEWITINSDINDRRQIKVLLTAKGKRRALWSKCDMQLFGRKTIDEMDDLVFKLIDALKKLRNGEKGKNNGR
jgi:DNA-binding MarR family transcriptional regulator